MRGRLMTLRTKCHTEHRTYGVSYRKEQMQFWRDTHPPQLDTLRASLGWSLITFEIVFGLNNGTDNNYIHFIKLWWGLYWLWTQMEERTWRVWSVCPTQVLWLLQGYHCWHWGRWALDNGSGTAHVGDGRRFVWRSVEFWVKPLFLNSHRQELDIWDWNPKVRPAWDTENSILRLWD